MADRYEAKARAVADAIGDYSRSVFGGNAVLFSASKAVELIAAALREQDAWWPINTAPKDGKTWVELRMPRATGEPGWWIATVVLDEDEENDGYIVSIKHYNGTNLVGIFHPSLRAEWRPIPAPPPDTGTAQIPSHEKGVGT